MDLIHFEAVTRTLTSRPSRRDVLRGLVGTGLGLGSLRLADVADAKKKRKRKKRKRKKRKPQARPNEFGCLEVGDPCKSEEQCCSGVCEGKKCRAHDTGTCKQDGQLAPCNNRTNCGCFTTTAGSDVCAELFPPSECAACQRDADCEALGFPLGSACIPYDCPSGFACMVPCGKVPPAA